MTFSGEKKLAWLRLSKDPVFHFENACLHDEGWLNLIAGVHSIWIVFRSNRSICYKSIWSCKGEITGRERCI